MNRSIQQGLLCRGGSLRFALLSLIALAFLWASSPSSAATPSHSRNPALDVEGLNHACGVAVDSKGDLYTSSAGASKIEIFSSTDHKTPIGEIANAKKPCGLAVTSTGILYVSEQTTSEVVRYKPAKYPFEGAPSYGPREVIDSSGQARGIAVDARDDRLYVATGSRIDAFNPDGSLGINEVQRAVPFGATGGFYKLVFSGDETKPLPYKATHLEVQAALEELASIGVGNVSVGEGTPSQEGRDHIITFVGALAHTDLSQITCNKSALEGSSANCITAVNENGFSGHIGEGDLEEAIGIAAYTYKGTSEKLTYYLAVADAGKDEIKLFSASTFRTQKLRRTLPGPKEGEEFGFGVSGAYLGSDPGTCPPAGQACTAGHFFVYDDAHEVLDELEAGGELVSQIPFAFGDGAPTAIAVDRSGGAGNGTIYATTGAGAGAEVLAFSPLGAPSRSGPLKEQSLTLKGVCGVAVDDYGNRYVAAGGPEVLVYPPSGSAELTKVSTGSSACRIAVDSEGNVYAMTGTTVSSFKPSSFPPKAGTTYGAAVTVAKQSEFVGEAINSLGVNPANDHLFVSNPGQTIEYDSAKEGSKPHPGFAGSLSLGSREAIAACAKTGNVYLSAGGSVFVLNAAGTEVLTQITGAGSPAGSISPHARAIAVDQSNCHLFAFEPSYKAGYDFESSGTFLAASGSFTVLVSTFGAAIDNGQFSPNRGDAYVAFDDTAPETFDLTAFGGLEYLEPPPSNKFPLTVKKTGTGSGTVTSSPPGISCGATCSAEYEEGEKVTLTATSAEGSEFKGWSGCDTEPEGNCKVAMSKAREVTAAFDKEEPVEPKFPLTVSLEGTGSGIVTSSPGLISCEPFCSDEFKAATVVTLTASPSPGSLFMAWKHCDKGGINGRQCTVTMSEAKQVQAVFITAHLLTVAKAEGSGPGKVSSYGGINCAYACTQTSALIKEGTAVIVKQAPAKHFHFAGFSGDCSGTGACELTMGEDHEVLADFQEDPKLSLSLSKTGGGQALIKTKPAGILCAYTCTDAVASFYEGEVVQVSWKLNKGTTKLTWSKGAGTCTGSSEALEGSCAVTMSAAEALVADLG